MNMKNWKINYLKLTDTGCESVKYYVQIQFKTSKMKKLLTVLALFLCIQGSAQVFLTVDAGVSHKRPSASITIGYDINEKFSVSLGGYGNSTQIVTVPNYVFAKGTYYMNLKNNVYFGLSLIPAVGFLDREVSKGTDLIYSHYENKTFVTGGGAASITWVVMKNGHFYVETSQIGKTTIFHTGFKFRF